MKSFVDVDMDAQEKWRRLNNPERLSDWGISLSLSEMAEFTEGRRIVDQLTRYENIRGKVSEILNNGSVAKEAILSKVLGVTNPTN